MPALLVVDHLPRHFLEQELADLVCPFGTLLSAVVVCSAGNHSVLDLSSSRTRKTQVEQWRLSMAKRSAGIASRLRWCKIQVPRRHRSL
jgi:hypothetical protein